MKFLTARRLVADTGNLPAFPLRFSMSGTPGQLGLFLQAHGVIHGISITPHFLPFGGFAQRLYDAPSEQDAAEIALLMPWDLVPACDWRTGLNIEISGSTEEAEAKLARFVTGTKRLLAYLPAPIPPVMAAGQHAGVLAAALEQIAVRYGAIVLERNDFSLATYLATGCPIAGNRVSSVAAQAIHLLRRSQCARIKVIVSDLDHTMWAGTVGEDGADAVFAAPEGRGFRHFLYQTLLKGLKRRGILLAVVSRNDLDVAREPFERQHMTLTLDDFVLIRAGYGEKSQHINELAAELNLGLDAFLYIDDNLVELAEMNDRVPSVTTLHFPENDEELPAFFDRIASYFRDFADTAEDRERTELYRRSLLSSPINRDAQITYSTFLQELSMKLTVFDSSGTGWQRAFQLINKTNQFNLNGRRWDEQEFLDVLAAGGRLFSVRLDDRTGTHGDIIACLQDVSGIVQAFAMSCRVLQRKVEYAFLAWLLRHETATRVCFAYQATARNEPLQMLMKETMFCQTTPELLYVELDRRRFSEAYGDILSLFSLHNEHV